MPSQSVELMKRRSVGLGYIAIAIVGGGLAVAVDGYTRRDLEEVRDHYVASEHAASLAVVEDVEAGIRAIYENLRTLSLLPSTRTIERHGNNISDEARLTFQQVYNNLANNVSISEVYILPAAFDPSRIDPVTGKLEEPILMFDELIVDARLRFLVENVDAELPAPTDPDHQDEVEIYEYHEMRRQLDWLAAKYPSLLGIDGLAVPLVSSSELITCDNTTFIHTLNDADREGIIFTVPVYGPDEMLHGAVSAVILSEALRGLLPSTAYSIVNAGTNFAVGPASAAAPQSLPATHPSVSEAPIYSEVLHINSAASNSPFSLVASQPNAHFYESADLRNAQFVTTLTYALVASIVAAATIVWYLVTRGFRAARAMSDSLERRVAERTAEIRYLATHDTLTGLANRHNLTQRLTEFLRTRREGATLAVHCLDLDAFKAVNDSQGHPAGDQLLKEVAERIRATIGEHDIAARFGGDEFVVVQAGEITAGGTEALARRLIARIREPFVLDGQLQYIGASIGIAIAPIDGESSERLLRNADIALYRAKGEQRGTFRFFEAEMDASLKARRILETELRSAVEHGEFVLHYQPLVEAAYGRVTGFEALARWQHPVHGLLPPSDFIGLAEDIGLIGRLGDWVLHRACADAVTWPGHRKVAVNISPAQFKNKMLAASVVAALDRSGLPAQRLELEITESALLENSDDTLIALHQLRTLGVTIAMDDFGTGFSSLSSLRSFPFDRIKIDRSFVTDILENKDCLSIVGAVAALGASLGMTTTAEGIETAEQLDLVKQRGCTDLQGYYFSRPMPHSSIADYLEKERRPAAAS